MPDPKRRIRLDGVENYLALQLDEGSRVIEFMGPLTRDGGLPVETLGDEQYLVLSILDANFRLAEIIHLVEYTEGSTQGTIDRAQEGTVARSHPAKSKVVHAPTVDDFLMVQDHDQDTNAHQDVIQQIATGLIDAAILRHKEESSIPHDYYAKKDSPTFTGNVVFAPGSTVSVHGDMRIESDGKLIINGDLLVVGRLVVNGRELYISNDPPPAGSQNMVWIQTFG